FFSSRRRHTRFSRDWSSDVCSSDLIPKALLGWDITFEMMITDKNGKLVYKTTDSAKPWNGRLNNNGELLPNDIYLWKVVTYDAQGNPYHHAGTIQLMTK